MRMNGYKALPKNMFMVKVPIQATYTDDEIEIFGLPYEVNNTDTDESLYTYKKRMATLGENNNYKEMVKVMLPLDKIIDIYIAGYPISLVNHKDVNKVYNILEEYISDHNASRTVMFNAPKGEDDRLEFIDGFIEEILGYNKVTIIKDVVKAPSGFNLGITKLNLDANNMNNTPRITTDPSVTSLYKNNNQNTTYIIDNTPVIDINKVKRTSPIKKFKGVKSNGGNNGNIN